MLLRAGPRRLDLSQPRVMGVLNLTPDSFSDGGRWFRDGRVDPGYAFDAALAMAAAGASILDIGGESTRPGAAPVAPDEEIRRVMPVLERVSSLDIMVSIDTRKPEVAAAALRNGAHLLNDVGGLRATGMLEILARTDAGACIMHMQGSPQTMQRAPHYTDVVAEVRAFFAERVLACTALGIETDRLVLDPGIGFGKTLAHNQALLANLGELTVKHLPLLVGVSRKRLIGDLTGKPVEQRLGGSLGAALAAVCAGARILRVHDVAATVDALRVFTTLRPPGG
jgi:dihydropteroate synthase